MGVRKDPKLTCRSFAFKGWRYDGVFDRWTRRTSNDDKILSIKSLSKEIMRERSIDEFDGFSSKQVR